MRGFAVVNSVGRLAYATIFPSLPYAKNVSWHLHEWGNHPPEWVHYDEPARAEAWVCQAITSLPPRTCGVAIIAVGVVLP